MWIAWLFFFLLGSPVFAESKVLVIIGDSLTEGYGVAKDASYPSVLQGLITNTKKDWKVIGAGVSGATSASGPSRVKWQLKSKPTMIVIALGANDALRGLKIEETEKNLSESIELAQKAGVKVALASLLAPPNYGKKFTDDFAAIFPKLKKKYSIILIPFLLEGVAGHSKLNIADGIHPNERGHQIIAKTVFKALESSL